MQSQKRLLLAAAGCSAVAAAALVYAWRRKRSGLLRRTSKPRVPYDEFSMFHENATEYGIPYGGPPQVRRTAVALPDQRKMSALVWGDAAPQIVFLHGGAQNAHTWDTVALALKVPILCIDLPSHGHSDDAAVAENDPASAAADVAAVMDALAPSADMVVGMSFGGLTGIALSAQRPDLVRRLVLVDVTPGVTRSKARHILDFVKGPEAFDSFDELLARTIQFNPTRSEASLRRGILHNALQREDGSWVWRHARFRGRIRSHASPSAPVDYAALWEAISALRVPCLLVRGMRASSVVDDADEAELLARLPSARVERFAAAGHSVQGDAPVELAGLLADYLRSPAGAASAL